MCRRSQTFLLTYLPLFVISQSVFKYAKTFMSQSKLCWQGRSLLECLVGSQSHLQRLDQSRIVSNCQTLQLISSKNELHCKRIRLFGIAHTVCIGTFELWQCQGSINAVPVTYWYGLRLIYTSYFKVRFYPTFFAIGYHAMVNKNAKESSAFSGSRLYKSQCKNALRNRKCKCTFKAFILKRETGLLNI